jgi:hypothetical protein
MNLFVMGDGAATWWSLNIRLWTSESALVCVSSNNLDIPLTARVTPPVEVVTTVPFTTIFSPSNPVSAVLR